MLARSSSRTKAALASEGQSSYLVSRALFVTAIQLVWSAGHWGNQVKLHQAVVQTHSSNKVCTNQSSWAGIAPGSLAVKCISTIHGIGKTPTTDHDVLFLELICQ